MIQIKCVGLRNEDHFWLADALHHSTGTWVRSEALAKHFVDKAEADAFLTLHGYDMPLERTVYETTNG